MYHVAMPGVLMSIVCGGAVPMFGAFMGSMCLVGVPCGRVRLHGASGCGEEDCWCAVRSRGVRAPPGACRRRR